MGREGRANSATWGAPLLLPCRGPSAPGSQAQVLGQHSPPDPSHSDYWFHLRYTTRCACVTGAGSSPCAPQAVTLPSTGTGSSTE